jgi:hypothetical protein
LEQGNRGATTIESTHQVDAQDFVPDFIRQCIEIGVVDEARSARVVDQHVEAAKFLATAANHCPDLGFVGDIAAAENGRHAVAFHLFERLLRLILGTRIVDGNCQPALGQQHRRRATDSRRRSSD